MECVRALHCNQSALGHAYNLVLGCVSGRLSIHSQHITSSIAVGWHACPFAIACKSQWKMVANVLGAIISHRFDTSETDTKRLADTQPHIKHSWLICIRCSLCWYLFPSGIRVEQQKEQNYLQINDTRGSIPTRGVNDHSNTRVENNKMSIHVVILN